MNIKRIINEEMLQPKSVPTSHHLSESKNINENEWEWAINSKPKWSTYYTSLLNDIKKLPILDLCNQYLRFIDNIKSVNIDLASEYLLMAAIMIFLKPCFFNSLIIALPTKPL